MAHATSVINPLSNRREFRARLTGSNCELALLCCGGAECPSPFFSEPTKRDAMTAATKSEQMVAHPSGNKLEPGIVVMDRPDGSWAPLRFAPFRYQANPHPLENPRMSQSQIDGFVRASVKDPGIIECAIHWETICFSISYLSRNGDDEDDIDFTHFMPCDARREFGSPNGDKRCAGACPQMPKWSLCERARRLLIRGLGRRRQ